VHAPCGGAEGGLKHREQHRRGLREERGYCPRFRGREVVLHGFETCYRKQKETVEGRMRQR
jgi:hypothetical protein